MSITYNLGKGFDLDAIIKYVIEKVVKGVSRRLYIKQSYVNPWTFTFDVEVFDGVLNAIFEALSNYRGNYNVATSIDAKKNKVVKITDLYTLHFHLYHLSSKSILPKRYFNRIIKRNKVLVIATEDKPFKLVMSTKKNKLTVSVGNTTLPMKMVSC